MTVFRLRLLLLVVAGLLALLASGVTRPREVSQAEQDRAEAQLADLELRDAPPPPPMIPVTRRQAVVCLRGAGFSVHSAPQDTIVVRGRGLAKTLVRIVGAGAPAAVPRDDIAWSATEQAIFKMPPTNDRELRRAFFDCIDPHAPAGTAR